MAVLLLLAGLVGGCAETQAWLATLAGGADDAGSDAGAGQNAPVTQADAGSVPNAWAFGPPKPESRPTVPARPDPDTILAVAPPPPPPPRPAESVDGDDSDRLIGLGQPDTLALLGPPDMRASRPPAQMWRYRATDCRLDVFFFMDLQTKTFRALAYEVESDDRTEEFERHCVTRVIAEADGAD